MKSDIYSWNEVLISLSDIETEYAKIKKDQDDLDLQLDYMPEWVREDIRKGNLGELIAEYYLKKLYNLPVKRVSIEDSHMGYDFQVGEKFFEVKTTELSEHTKSKFFITRNEIEKAIQNRDNYVVILICISNSKIQIIMINQLGKHLKEIKKQVNDVNDRGIKAYMQEFLIELDFLLYKEYEKVEIPIEGDIKFYIEVYRKGKYRDSEYEKKEESDR